MTQNYTFIKKPKNIIYIFTIYCTIYKNIFSKKIIYLMD